MDIRVDRTEQFEKEYKRLSMEARATVAEKMNILISQLQSGNRHSLYRVRQLSFPASFNRSSSTLYLYRVNTNLRAIVSFDDDPIFSQKILTIYSIATHDKLFDSFKKIASKLYRQWEK